MLFLRYTDTQQKEVYQYEKNLQVINLRRPGLLAVQRIMGWTPLHLAAAEGEVRLMESLIQEQGCDILARSVNSWTPLHYAAAHNKVPQTLWGLAPLNVKVSQCKCCLVLLRLNK